MKIAFFIPIFPILSETFLLNRVTGLIDRGHQVDLFSFVKGAHPKTHPDVLKYELDVKTTYLPQLRLEEIKELAAREYDIIQACFGMSGLYLLRIRDKLGILGGKLVTSFHGFDLTHHIQLFGERVYDELFERGALFLPVCDYFKKRLINLGCDPVKVSVLRTGIHSARFSTLMKDSQVIRDRSSYPVRFLSVCRLVEKKGIEYSIRAFAEVVKLYPDIEYNIIGDGELREKLQALIEEVGLQTRVFLRGWADQPEVVEWMRQSHIMIAPSVTGSDGNQEGVPNALKEAMCTGLPVITTKHAGIPELVQDGLTGILVPEKSVAALVTAMKCLMSDKNRGEGMGHAASLFVREHYDAETLNNQLVSLYEQLLEV